MSYNLKTKSKSKLQIFFKTFALNVLRVAFKPKIKVNYSFALFEKIFGMCEHLVFEKRKKEHLVLVQLWGQKAN